MSSASLTLLFSVCFILFAGVTANIPPWIANNYNFACSPICSEYLKGETYSCLSASGFGLAAGTVVIRVLPNFDWRYYTIQEEKGSNEFCQSVLAADYFYSHKNGTVCNPVFDKDNDFYYDDIRTRSSGGKRKFESSKMEKLFGFLEQIKNLAKEIQTEAMMTDEVILEEANISPNKRSELTNVRSKRLFSALGTLAKNVLGAVGLFNTVSSQNVHNITQMYYSPTNIENYGALNNTVQNEYNEIPPYYDVTRRENPKHHHPGGDKSWNGSHDSRADAICFWASKNMCHYRKMVVCVQGVCCWAKLNTKSCSLIDSDNGINIYRENIFSIIQAAKLT